MKRRHVTWPNPALNLTVGVLFGLGAVMAMSLRTELGQSVFVDGRSVMTGLVATFGGPLAAIVTVAITVAYRAWLGGPTVLAGVLAAIGAGVVGVVFAELRRRYRFRLGAPAFLLLGVAVVTVGFTHLAIFNVTAGKETLSITAVALYLVVPVSMVLLGSALLAEDERLLLQSKLTEQSELLEAVFNSMSDGVAVADTGGKVILSNPTARMLWGQSGRGDQDNAKIGDFGILELDGRTPFSADQLPLSRALRGEETNDVQMIFANRIAGHRLVSVGGRPLRDARGRMRGGVIVFNDITQARRMQETLRRSEERLKEAIDAMESGFALFDAADRLVVCNEGFIDDGTRATFGNPVGRTFEEIFQAFSQSEMTAADALADREGWLFRRMALHRDPPDEPLEIQWTDGRWMRVTERRTAEGGYVGIWSDITALKAAERRLRDAIESIPEGFALLDADMRFVIYNHRFLDLYPLSAGAVAVGASFEQMLRAGAERGEYPDLAPEEAEDFVKVSMARFRGEEPYFGEGAFADGRWVLVSHRQTWSGDYVTIRTDITVQKLRERDLANLLQELRAAQGATERAHEESQRVSTLLRSITDAVPALVAYVDAEERYQYCNKEYQDIFGIDPASLIGRPIGEEVEAEVYDVVKPQIAVALQGQETAFVRPMIVGGETRYVEQRYIPKFGGDGVVDGFYAVGWDITDSHRRELALSMEASTDALTGLLNRRAMMEALDAESQRWRTPGITGAVLYLDIDRFKTVNDTLGHDVGDALLKVFAERIRAVVRTSDKVARLGGDEFVILLTAPNAEEVARRIAQTLLTRMREPITLGQTEARISTSIGIAVAMQVETTAHHVLKEADLALYEAKAAGRDTFSLRVVG